MDVPLGAFFKQFLPEFLSKMEDLDSNQREKLQATFNEEIVSINYWITLNWHSILSLFYPFFIFAGFAYFYLEPNPVY